jgi:hypothetical protein
MTQIAGCGLLGFGMNVLQTAPNEATLQSIITPPTGRSGVYLWNDQSYEVPNNVTVTPGFGDATASATCIVGSSRADFQNQYNARLGITASYNAFSGAFDLAFSAEEKSTQQYWYCAVFSQFEAYTLLLQADAAELSPEFVSDSDVVALMAQTAFDITNPAPFFNVFAKWGTHYVTQVSMGANLAYNAAVQTSTTTTETDVAANLTLEYKAVFVSGKAEASAEWKTLGETWAESRTVKVEVTGGDASALNGVDPAYQDNLNAQFEAWIASIPANLGVMQLTVRDLSTLFSGQTQQLVAQALQAYLGGVVLASASMTTPGVETVTSGACLVQVAGTTVSPPTPVSTTANGGAAQLVILDPADLSVTANVAAACELVTTEDLAAQYAAFWAPFTAALQQGAQNQAVVALGVAGFNNQDGFPPADMIGYLKACGAGLDGWASTSSMNAGDDFNVCYALVGQQGMVAGGAVETFSIDIDPKGLPAPGSYFAAGTGLLIPAVQGGSFTLVAADAG